MTALMFYLIICANKKVDSQIILVSIKLFLHYHWFAHNCQNEKCCLKQPKTYFGVPDRLFPVPVKKEMEKSEANNFLVLFRDAGCQFRSLYTYCPETEDINKLAGIGPKSITRKMIDGLYKYNSDKKQFSQIPAKTMSASVDAVTIHNHLWQTKKPATPKKVVPAQTWWTWMLQNLSISFSSPVKTNPFQFALHCTYPWRFKHLQCRLDWMHLCLLHVVCLFPSLHSHPGTLPLFLNQAEHDQRVGTTGMYSAVKE